MRDRCQGDSMKTHDALSCSLRSASWHQLCRSSASGASVAARLSPSYQASSLYSQCLLAQRENLFYLLLATCGTKTAARASATTQTAAMCPGVAPEIKESPNLKSQRGSAARNATPFQRPNKNQYAVLYASQRKPANGTQRTYVDSFATKNPPLTEAYKPRAGDLTDSISEQNWLSSLKKTAGEPHRHVLTQVRQSNRLVKKKYTNRKRYVKQTNHPKS